MSESTEFRQEQTELVSTKDSFNKIIEDNKLYEVLKSHAKFKRYNENDVNDLIQETLVRCFDAFTKGQLDVEKGIKSYVKTIMDRIVIDNSRRRLVRQKEKTAVEYEYSGTVMAGNESDPEELALSRQQIEIIKNNYSTLTEEEQELFKLRYIDDLSGKEIAKKTGLNENTVKTKIRRLITKLKEKLAN